MTQEFFLPELEYPLDGLEPIISKEILEVNEPKQELQKAHSVDQNSEIFDNSQEFFSNMMGDAPPCDNCGHITVRNGNCYRCLNCGHSLGCS